MKKILTQEQFVEALPKQLRKNVNPLMIRKINKILQDEDARENFKDNLLSYTSVIKTGKYKIQSYVDAVHFVSLKLLGNTDLSSYTKTFPDRYKRFISVGKSPKDISSFVSAYNKTKLVQLIYEQTLTPSHVLNADIYQRAINTQAELMLTANSEKVRSDAANSLLTHLKPPETQKIELDIGIKGDSSIDDLRASTQELVNQQKEMIKRGLTTAKETAHSKLLIVEGDSEVIDVN